VMARVVILQAPDEAGGVIEPGDSRIVQLRLESAITALPGDRFIIRSYSPQMTIGGGVVIDALPEKHRLRDRTAHVWLERLEQAEATERAALFIEMAGPRAMSAAEIAARSGATDAQINELAAALVRAGRVIEIANAPLVLLATESYDALAARVRAVLGEHHRREPLSLGMSREEVRERLFGTLRPEVFRAVINRLTEAGGVAAERETLRLSSHRPALSDADATAKQALEATFKAAGWQAPTLEEAAAGAGVKVEMARKLLTLLAAEQRIVRIGDFVFHREAIDELKSRVQARKAISAKIDVAVFKEITGGLTRKYAIPLLEFLDRERVTRRIGNEREIL
ncbi:MAG TPA: SelB C-terminal domain-containing protein, partial [Blastocatellia bacterium]